MEELELSVKNLSVNFKTGKGIVHAVRNISFDLKKGETLAIVGESGSGKSVTAKAILGIESPNAIIESGSIVYEGRDLLKFTEKDFNQIRGNKISMIFQDPLSSLDPIVRIGPQLTEASILNGRRNQKNAMKELRNLCREFRKVLDNDILFSEIKRDLECAKKKYSDFYKCHGDVKCDEDYFEIPIDRFETGSLESDIYECIRGLVKKAALKVTKKMAYDKAIDIMREVGITEPEKRFRQYPFEFSGGMRQRIVIAIAIASNPDLLICDEPTTALDVTIQAQILELIKKIRKERNMSVLFITHDLGVVANMADRIAVMYAGKIVEIGTAEDIFYYPKHPYTWALLESVPDMNSKEKLKAIPGTPPNMLNPPAGDAFAPRNKYALKIDFEKEPPMFKVSETHFASTWLLHPSSPKVECPITTGKHKLTNGGFVNGGKIND